MADDNTAPAAPAPVVDPNAAPQVPPPAPALAPEPPAPPPGPAVPQAVFDRIDGLTKRAKTAEELLIANGIDPKTGLRIAAPQAQPAPLPTPQFTPAPQPAPTPSFDPNAIETRAQQLANERAFATQCNTIEAAGSGAHVDFKVRVAQLGQLGVLSPSLINASVELGDAHEVLYALGADLNEATRIAALPPEQQGIALYRFDAKRKEQAQARISQAPVPPGVAVGTPAPITSDIPLPQDKSDDWFAKREKQIGLKSGNYG